MTIIVKSRPKTMSTDSGPRKRFENPLVFAPILGMFPPKILVFRDSNSWIKCPLVQFYGTLSLLMIL